MRQTFVRSIATAVTAVAMVGALAQVVVAAGSTSRDAAKGPRQVEADPTPTPSPTPTPPTDRTTVATITALTFIDPDGDLTTNDRHVYDGRWDFNADLEPAEVLSAAPYSDWLESALWRISYDAAFQIWITAVPRNGYVLLDIHCVASHNVDGWDADGTTVSWMAPIAGPEPVSLHCTFTQSPTSFVPVEGSVEVIKLLDPDGDSATDNSVYSTQEFTFAVHAEGADATAVNTTSVNGNGAHFVLAYEDASAQVVISETEQDGFELVGARCEDFRFNDVVVPVTVSGSTASFKAIAPDGFVDGQYGCYLTNARTGASPPSTLPQTDTGEGMRGRHRVWPPLLLLVGAGVGALAVGINGRSRRHPNERKES